MLHVLARAADDSPALYLVSDGIGTRSPPHEHLAWAVIAGVRGREANISYRVLPDEPRTVFHDSVVEVGPGDVLVMEPFDVHATEVVGDRGTFHLHLYGCPLDRLPPFAARCYAIAPALAAEPQPGSPLDVIWDSGATGRQSPGASQSVDIIRRMRDERYGR